MNLSFLNFQLTSPMGCCDRVIGTRQNSDCWSPLWWSWSSQAFAWPTTITGHVRHLGWFTELDVWLLYNFEATLKYVLILTGNFTQTTAWKTHVPCLQLGFFSARGCISDQHYCPCHRAGHRGRFGWVPLVQCCFSVSWFLTP